MTAPQAENAASPTGVSSPFMIATGVLAAVAGSAGFLVVPMVIAALRHGGATEAWVGLIGSADPAGMFFGALVALHPFLRLRSRKFTIVALSAALSCNFASTMVHAPAVLLVIRCFSGFSGGLALALSLGILARTRVPDRSFALLALAQMTFSTLVSWLADGGQGGLDTIYACMFALQSVGIAATLLINGHQIPIFITAAYRRGPSRIGLRLPVCAIVGNFLSAAGFLMLWANIQACASNAGLPAQTAVAIFDVGLMGGVVGTLVPLVHDLRKWRAPIAVGLFLLNMAMIVVIATTSSFSLFSIAAFVFQFSTATAFFGFGAVSEADPTGRLPIVHVLAVKAGFGVAPLAASTIIARHGLTAVLVCSFVATFLAMISYLCLFKLSYSNQTEGSGTVISE